MRKDCKKCFKLFCTLVPGEIESQAFREVPVCTMHNALCEKDEYIFKLARRTYDGKIDFLVLVTKLAYVFTQGSPTWSGFAFKSYDKKIIFGHNFKTKRAYSNLV